MFTQKELWGRYVIFSGKSNVRQICHVYKKGLSYDYVMFTYKSYWTGISYFHKEAIVKLFHVFTKEL